MNEENGIRTSAKIESLKALRDHAAACAGRFGCSPLRVRQIELAVEEALVNIFSFAYGEGAGEVEMICREIAGEKLLIEIIDSGKPFDPIAVPPPDLDDTVALRKVGGMGILILRRYADGLAYKREGNRNVLMISIMRRNAAW